MSHPLQVMSPKEMELTDADELNLATISDVYFQHTLDDNASFPNDPDVDDNQLAEFLAVVVDRTGKPVEVRSNNDQFSCDIRNLKSAQSQFPLVTQPKKMISQTGGSVQERIAEERESSHAQIRTMLDEQRRTIIAECSDKVLHHDLLAAQAEQDRKILQEEILRQQQEFREVHQQDLMKQQELQKFQNSTFDEFAQKKFIEDQKIIMELSGRLQPQTHCDAATSVMLRWPLPQQSAGRTPQRLRIHSVPDFLRRRSHALLIHFDVQGKSGLTSALCMRAPGNVRQGCGAVKLRSLGRLGEG